MRRELFITSPSNPQIKRLVSLRKKQSPHEILVEGLREAACALEAGVAFRQIYFCPTVSKSDACRDFICRIEKKNIEFFEVTSDVFEKISFGQTRDGLLAVCDRPDVSLARIVLSPKNLVVVLESIEKPGNLGAILRACDGAGVDAVLIVNKKTDIFNPNVIRSSLGTVFLRQIALVDNAQAYSFLKGNNIKILAALPGASRKYTDCDGRGPLAIVLGSEQDGLSDFWKTKADESVRIPMKGGADSLNVSASAAVLLYEMLRQRNE